MENNNTSILRRQLSSVRCVCLMTSRQVCRVQAVTIHRNGSRQKVGLTLCYGSPCDGFTDVFVSEVSLRVSSSLQLGVVKNNE